MRYKLHEFRICSTGLESMANVMRHYEQSKWYQSRVVLVVRYNQPSQFHESTLVHTMQYVARK